MRVLSKQGSNPKYFSVDARTLLTLGRDSIKDHTTALIELVKNSYDADASRVDIEIVSAPANPTNTHIRVADNGCGMTEVDIDRYWLRIGYSEKLFKTKSEQKHRRKTGEKGIGRLSADRLGASLNLHTKARGNAPIGLSVNWDDFNNHGQDLARIPIQFISNPPIRLPAIEEATPSKASAQSGTELIASNLRHRWTEEDMEVLYEELSILTPPFDQVRDFEINLSSDIAPQFAGKVTSLATNNALLSLTADFDGKAKINYTVTERAEGGKAPHTSSGSIAFDQITQRITSRKQDKSKNKDQVHVLCGPIRVALLFFPRKAETLQGTSLNLGTLRNFLDRNAGIKIYRDNIRVKPYGNPGAPEGDWLKLGDRKARNPAGASRDDFRIAPNQIVGAIFIGRDTNPELIDSSSREGLIQGKAFEDLKELAMGCIRLLEAQYHKLYTRDGAQDSADANPRAAQNIKALDNNLRELAKGLREAQGTLPKNSAKKLGGSISQISTAIEQIQAAQKSIEQLASQATIYRGLATIGIASIVFGHETQASISQFVSSTQTAILILEQPQPEFSDALDELRTAKLQAEKVASWGSFALARLKRDKRRMRQVDIKELFEGLIKGLKPALEASNISVEANLAPITGKTFAIDLESVLVNLVTNSYSACQQTKRPRVIWIKTSEKSTNGRRGVELIVSDSGPSIAKEFVEQIWKPLFTTKRDMDPTFRTSRS